MIGNWIEDNFLYPLQNLVLFLLLNFSQNLLLKQVKPLTLGSSGKGFWLGMRWKDLGFYSVSQKKITYEKTIVEVDISSC